MRYPQAYHRADAHEIKPLCTSISDNRAYAAAQCGCEALANGINCIAPQTDRPSQTRTFDEQLALVADGKAHVIDAIPIRKADPDYTIGGVSW